MKVTGYCYLRVFSTNKPMRAMTFSVQDCFKVLYDAWWFGKMPNFYLP